MRHNCNKAANGTSWNLCAACEGRIHSPGCTSKRDKRKDCCEARHVMLHEQGQTTWINDESQPMLGSHAGAMVALYRLVGRD